MGLLHRQQKKAVAIAVRNVSGRRTWSKLAEWLFLAERLPSKYRIPRNFYLI
jgi:hypothetical protein